MLAAVPPGGSGRGTVFSPDGELQIQTDWPSGKVTVLRPTEFEIQVIEKRANDGDAAAQMILSQVQYALTNSTEGERWLRKAAQTGNIFAEYTLGTEFACGIFSHRSPGHDEAVVWLKLAAYEGYSAAQHDLSQCYHLGLGVEKNELEAYSWHLISLRSWPWTEDIMVKSAPPFEKLLSTAQIEQGKARAKNFVPTVNERNPFVDMGMIKLKAISESNKKPIALLNDQAFALGEQKKVSWLGKGIETRCLEIRTNCVIIATEPYWQRGELRQPK
jgi:hypothetical protein